MANKYFNAPENVTDKAAWEKHANNWAALYLIYDDDERCMEEVFYNNNMPFFTVSQLIETCQDIALHIGREYIDDPELLTYWETANEPEQQRLALNKNLYSGLAEMPW